MEPTNNTPTLPTASEWQIHERPYSLEWFIAKVDYWLARVSFGVLGGQGQQVPSESWAQNGENAKVKDLKPIKNKPYSPENFNAAQASLDAIFPTAGQGNDWSQLTNKNAASSTYNKITTPSLTAGAVSGQNRTTSSALQKQTPRPAQNKPASVLTAEQLLALLNEEPSHQFNVETPEDGFDAQETSGMNVLSQNNRTVSHSINQLVEHYFATQGSDI